MSFRSFATRAEDEVPFLDPTVETTHRPWPLPEVPWIQRMRWHDHLFVHWPFKAGSLRPLVPASLDMDTFENEAWVGITPFRISKVGVRYLPDLPLVPSSLMIAVRTYVVAEDKPGVWFFSIDASNKIIAILGRSAFRLPFFNADMALEEGYGGRSFWAQRADRRAPRGVFEALYSPFGDSFRPAKGTLEAFLTDRYCLYTTSGGSVYRTELHHKPLLLWTADGTCLINDYLSCNHLDTPRTLPLLHFARNLDVVMYAAQPL